MKLCDISVNERKMPLIMGILNVTPDSFSDGGLYMDTDEAVSHALLLCEQGADIIDIGGESTRPGFIPVSADEELARVVPVISGLRQITSVPLSIDTTKANVAEEALKFGCSLVNDVSGEFNPDMARVVSSYDASLCIAHNSKVDEVLFLTNPEEVLADINNSLKSLAAAYAYAGVDKDKIVIDPGIGFGKSNAVSAYILKHLDEFGCEGYLRLLGCSGKSVFEDMFGFKKGERLEATLCSSVFAYKAGFDMLRVHNVVANRRMLTAFSGMLDESEKY